MSILDFQMPEKVVMEKADDFHGIFTFQPLEKGYGVTVGNALRRILLSSLEGYAITGIRIPQVLHEFSTREGVVEDVSEIILNLKMVRFKALEQVKGNTIIPIKVKNKKEFRAGDLAEATELFEILNPDHVICHLDKSADLEIEMDVRKGKGYVGAEENSNIAPTDLVGHIAIDSIFTPIKNVKYSVENTRVEQKTDYEKLTLEISTDGSVHPDDALKSASSILIQHFMLFSDQNMIAETQKIGLPEQVNEELLHIRKLLKIGLGSLDLSVRAYNCLKAANIKTLGELVTLEISDMMKFRNFGKKSLTELEQLLSDKGLSFGMDTSKYKLEEE